MSAPLQAEIGAALRAVMDEMSASTSQLLLVLDEERQALGLADADALNRAGEAKQMLIRRLEQLDVERLQMIAASPQIALQMQPAWSRTLKSLGTCRDNNQRNGALVSQRLAQVRGALAVLTGTASEAGTYGRSGEWCAGGRSVPLAQA